MSYSLTGRIVNLTTHKELAYCDVSFLKHVGGNRSYSSEFENIYADYTIGDEFNDLLLSEHTSYVGIYPKSVIDLSSEFVPSNHQYGMKVGKSFTIKKETLECLDIADKAVAYSDIDRINSGELNPDDYVHIVESWLEIDSGRWYREEAFEEYRKTVETRLKEEREQLGKLTSLKFTKDYFEMSEKAKSELFDEISYSEDAIEEYENELWSITKIINILCFYANDLHIKDENGEFMYYEQRKVAIYINAD